jgi:glycosyltransferase involved in cell wall biosynthesis
MPKISIITPVYNGENFIEFAIQNIIKQNCDDLEHIIIDGESTDNTINIVNKYALEYPHIRWISEKDNGQSDAMNKGIKMARGEILSFLNADDYYEPNVLNRVSKLFSDLPDSSFLAGNCNIWDEQGLRGVNKPKKLEFEDLLLGRNINPYPVNPSAYFYHTSLHKEAGMYDVEEHYALDYDFLFRVAQVANLYYVDETWGNMRVIQGTKTSADSQSGKGAIRIHRLIRTYRKKLPFLKRLKVTFVFELSRLSEKVLYFSKHQDEIIPKLITRLSSPRL